MICESLSWQDTFSIAVELGKRVQPGEIYCLEGELGVGKTVFAKGFARGLGIMESITSPTFTIIQEYESGRIPLYHFDVYRIAEPEEMFELGYEGYFFGDGVCLIEWASRIQELLPAECGQIFIEKDLKKGFDYRKITISGEMGGYHEYSGN